MRSTLIVVVAIVICVMAVESAIAGEFNWSAGISLTEKESGVQIGSRIEASREGRFIGSWFSSSGQLPVMVMGLDYDAFGDFPAIRNILEVVLSPDHGKTEWSAEQVEGKGYTVDLPTLPSGSYGLEWLVVSKDKHNKLMLIIIPINWNSRRATGATNHAMVQHPPLESESFSDQQWFALLRGFVPAWASFDPAFLAQQQMAGQSAPQGQSPQGTVPETIPQVAPPPSPPPAPKAPSYPEDNSHPHNSYNGDEADVTVTLALLDGHWKESARSIIPSVPNGGKLIFRRAGVVVAEATVTRVIPGRLIEARVIKGGGVRPGDKISMRTKEGGK